jgi:hypothetical protein
MKIITLLAAAAAIAFVPVSASFAAKSLSEAECISLMQKMDKNADGSMDAAESKAILAKMDEMKMPHASADTVSKEEFMQGCGSGAFEGMDNQ